MTYIDIFRVISLYSIFHKPWVRKYHSHILQEKHPRAAYALNSQLPDPNNSKPANFDNKSPTFQVTGMLENKDPSKMRGRACKEYGSLWNAS